MSLISIFTEGAPSKILSVFFLLTKQLVYLTAKKFALWLEIFLNFTKKPM